MKAYMSECVRAHVRERERITLVQEAVDTLKFREYNLGVPELQELKNSSKRLTKLPILNVSIVEGSPKPIIFGKGRNISV